MSREGPNEVSRATMHISMGGPPSAPQDSQVSLSELVVHLSLEDSQYGWSSGCPHRRPW